MRMKPKLDCFTFHGAHCKPMARSRVRQFWPWHAARAKFFKRILPCRSAALLDPAVACQINQLVLRGWLCRPKDGEWARVYCFEGDRLQNKSSSAEAALQMLMDYLNGLRDLNADFRKEK